MANAKKFLASLGLTAAVATGLVGEYYVNPDIHLAGMSFTGYEYSQLKPKILSKIKNISACNEMLVKSGKSAAEIAYIDDNCFDIKQKQVLDGIMTREITGEKIPYNQCSGSHIYEKLNDYLETKCK